MWEFYFQSSTVSCARMSLDTEDPIDWPWVLIPLVEVTLWCNASAQHQQRQLGKEESHAPPLAQRTEMSSEDYQLKKQRTMLWLTGLVGVNKILKIIKIMAIDLTWSTELENCTLFFLWDKCTRKSKLTYYIKLDLRAASYFGTSSLQVMRCWT